MQLLQFLIGYNRGLIVLWDMRERNADQTYNATQQLESVCWHRDGTQFMSAHSDGSYITWSASDATKPKEQATTPYGKYINLLIKNKTTQFLSWQSIGLSYYFAN